MQNYRQRYHHNINVKKPDLDKIARDIEADKLEYRVNKINLEKQILAEPNIPLSVIKTFGINRSQFENPEVIDKIYETRQKWESFTKHHQVGTHKSLKEPATAHKLLYSKDAFEKRNIKLDQ